MWAFKRKWYIDSNINDMTVFGGGDTFLLYSLINPLFFYKKQDMKGYKELYKPLTYDSIDNCNLNIYHLFHGLNIKRQYYSRFINLFELFKKHNISSIKDIITRRNDNVLEWKPEYKELMNCHMINYFNNRDDDSFNEIPNKIINLYLLCILLQQIEIWRLYYVFLILPNT